MAAVAGVARAVRPTLWFFAAAVGIAALVVVRHDPGYSPAGPSIIGAAAALIPGYALVAVGLVTWVGRPSSRSGPLLAAAGLSWFVVEWNNPGVGWAPAFTMGLIGFGVCPAVVAHAVLAYPNGRLASSVERLAVGVAYTCCLLVLGVLPALLFDPGAQGCNQCTRNLLRVLDAPMVHDHVARVGVGLALGSSVALVVVVIRQLVRSTPPLRRLKGPVAVAGAGYLAFVAWDYSHDLFRPVLGLDAWDRRLWLAQAGALVALAAGVAFGIFRGRHTRRRVARLVVDLAASPPAGGLRDVLAETLGDDSLRLGYPLSGGEVVDARGSSLTVDGPATTLVRGRQRMAVLTHLPGVLDDPALAEEVARAARLVLDNERLHAERAAQLQRLQASRQRIVATGDAERRRLERDLHDGAQQRLVTALLEVRLNRNRWGPDADPNLLARAGEVETELEFAVEELRELAHGIFPAVLADEGLAQAVDDFAERAEIPVRITTLDDIRLDPAAESAAYFAIAEWINRSGAHGATVSITRCSRQLCVEVQLDDAGCPDRARWILDVEDRVGAVDGRLEVSRTKTGRLRVRAEIPCES